jgi:hypothetical protein
MLELERGKEKLPLLQMDIISYASEMNCKFTNQRPQGTKKLYFRLHIYRWVGYSLSPRKLQEQNPLHSSRSNQLGVQTT